MHASEAALWFANTALDGWDGTAWERNITAGDFHTYDRFITERTFGAKKRIFLTHEDNAFDPTDYPVVRTPDGKIWIVVSQNPDIDGQAYAQSYLLVIAGFTASVIAFQTTTLSSGQQGNLVELVAATHYCDLEQFSVDRSDNFNATTYGLFKIVLPGNATVTDNNEITVDGTRYEIQETYPELLTVAVRALRRGPSG